MKRTKNINRDAFRKSWRFAPVAIAVSAVFMLAGCEKTDETVSLYQECIKYNKSLKIKPIDGTYDGQYKQGGELDLSVFPENIIKLDLENEDNWGEPDHIA